MTKSNKGSININHSQIFRHIHASLNRLTVIELNVIVNSPRHYLNGKFLPVWEVSIRSGSYVVDLLDPNGKKLPEREVGFL